MPWNPGIQDQRGQLAFQGITNATNILSQDLLKALNKYEEDKKQREFNTGLLDTLKDDPNTARYVRAEALQRWDSMNSDKQAGVLAGMTRRISTDVQQQQLDRQNQLAAAQAEEAQARSNLLWAQGQNEWSGQGADANLNLTPEEIAAGKDIGKIPLRTSGKSFQWAEDPNNPANLGTAAPVPVDKFGRPVNPADLTAEVIGLQNPSTGAVHNLPKPSQVQELINAGLIKPQARAPQAPTPTPVPGSTATPRPMPAAVEVKTPAEAQALPKGTRYQTPDGKIYVR
jgi:hypothetical protein